MQKKYFLPYSSLRSRKLNGEGFWKIALLFSVVVFLSSQLPAQCDMSASRSRDASWSPDGKTIVYSSNTTGNQEIYLMDADGENNRKLTDTKHPNYYPFFSPDGMKIVFMAYRNNTSVICTINSDGSDFQSLTPDHIENADPSWSPDGAQIIFYSNRDGNNEIYLMDTQGRNAVRLTNHPASDQTPSISPDGSKVVFVSDRDGNAELYLMNSEGGDLTRLTTDPRSDRVPRWSPDGKSIVYYSREPTSVTGSGSTSWNGSEIYEIQLDGTRKQLTLNHVMDHGPEISPDGTRILFTSCRTGNREVFVMKRDGSRLQRLTFTTKND